MRKIHGVLLAAALLQPVTMTGQERDAQVLRPGELRLHAGADFLRSPEIIGPAAGDSRLWPARALTPAVFAPLASLPQDLDEFIDATGGSAPTLGDLSAGDLSLDSSLGSRILPVGLSIGILRGLEVGVTLPIYRNQRLLRRADLDNGNVGLNPDAAANSRLMGMIAPSFARLGKATLLPIASSPLGIELQRRVQQATGGVLKLPANPLTAAELLGTFPLDGLRRTVTPWTPGDLEMHARFELLSTFRDFAFPTSPGFHYRVALDAAARLPTGQSADTIFAVGVGPAAGATGGSFGATGDVFVGDRYWLTGSGAWATVSETKYEGRLVPTWMVGSSAGTFTVGGGTNLDVSLIGRIRLTREISVGATAAYAGSSERNLSSADAPLASLAAESRATGGLTLRYTTQPVSDADTSSGMPADLAFGFSTTLTSSGTTAEVGSAFLRVSFFPRLWGRNPAP